MTLELEDYQLLFDEYLDTGGFPEGLEEDCLAEYLKQMLDDEETRFKCTSDPIWRDLVKIFIAVVQGLIRLGCVRGLHPLIWPQMVFSGMKNANVFHLSEILVL